MLTFDGSPPVSSSERWNDIVASWDAAVEQLKKRPGEWAYVEDVPRRDFERIKVRYQDRPLEFKGRGLRTGRKGYEKVWVRWKQ